METSFTRHGLWIDGLHITRRIRETAMVEQRRWTIQAGLAKPSGPESGAGASPVGLSTGSISLTPAYCQFAAMTGASAVW